MSEITTAARKKLYFNLVKKLNDGKTLTRNERTQFDELSEEFSPDKKDDSDSGFLVSVDRLCKLFATSKMGITRWVKQGAPKAAHGRYNLEEFVSWWLRNANQNQTKKTIEGKERYWNARADGEEIKVQHNIKALVPLASVKKWLRMTMVKIKTRLLSMPQKISAGLEGLEWHEIQKKLDADFRFVLEEVGDSFSGKDVRRGAETTAKTKSVGMG